MAVYLGTAVPTAYYFGSTAVSKVYLGSTQVWPVASGALLTISRNNGSGVTSSFSGSGTTASPYTRTAGDYLDDTNGLSHYAWTASASCTVTVSFFFSDDDDNAYRARILRDGTPQDIGPGASPNPTRRPPPEPQYDYSGTGGMTTTGTLAMTAGQVLTFTATGPSMTQFFANVSVSAA